MEKKIPIAINQNNELVYIKEPGEDPVIGIRGRRGMGMSLMLHRFADLGYRKGDRKIVVLSDIKNKDKLIKTWPEAKK